MRAMDEILLDIHVESRTADKKLCFFSVHRYTDRQVTLRPYSRHTDRVCRRVGLSAWHATLNVILQWPLRSGQ